MKSLVTRMARIQEWITFWCIALLTVTVFVQVFVRYVLQRPLFLWSEELSRFILIWMVFLGIGVGVKNDAHFAMDVLPPALGRRWGNVVRLFNDLCMGTILVLLLLAGMRFTYFGLYQNSPNMEILMFWVFASIPLGAVLALIYLVERMQHRTREIQGEEQ